MHIKSILLFTVTVFFFSCSSGSNNDSAASASAPQSARVEYDRSLIAGKVTDSVICKNQSNQSYVLFLPSYYSPDKKFPCIYFFDAHARGALPVKKYKDLAEKYGFVLIGSNMSKNGTQWQQTNDDFQILLHDTRARINIDTQRIYTSGFSGGSHVASSIAIFDGGVAGVIGCAAGFPRVEQGIQHKFDYFGMAGVYDFNLIDMEQLDAALQQNGFTHQLLSFNGKHEWPPLSDFHTALLWMQINAMKKKLQPKNDSLIALLKNDYEKRIAEAKTNADLVKMHDLLDGVVSALDGLTDVSSYKKQLAEETGDALKNALALQALQQQMESARQQELAQAFTVHDEKWWSKKIAELNNDAHVAKTQQQSQIYRRLVNFLGLVGYLNSDNALKHGDLGNAINYLTIFKMADPQNPDCAYLTAIYYVKKGNPELAISSLDEAASLGFSDFSQLITDPAFSSLQNDTRFKSTADKVRENASK